MNREEILKAIDAILELRPSDFFKGNSGNKPYLTVENPDYGNISSEEYPSLVIDFEVLRKLVAE